MQLSAPEYNVLSYLLKNNVMSFEKANEWTYAQYTNNGVDPFIEKLSLASDVSEMLELIANDFQVYGKPSQDFLAGETASKYSREELSLYDSITRILFDLEVELTEAEQQELYIAEDYFGWHDLAEKEAWNHVRDIFSKYHSIYEKAVGVFNL